MLTFTKRKDGFTVVELLVVIAVIGILATITIIGYSGFQRQARNASRIDYAQQFVDIVKIAATENKFNDIVAAMDHADGWDKACLGTGYSDRTGDGRADCAVFDGASYISDTPTFNTLLSGTALPSMAKYSPVTSTDGDVTYGPYVYSVAVDGTQSIVMEYVLEGLNQTCMVKPLVYPSGSLYTLTPPANAKSSVSAYGVTECWVMLIKDS